MPEGGSVRLADGVELAAQHLAVLPRLRRRLGEVRVQGLEKVADLAVRPKRGAQHHFGGGRARQRTQDREVVPGAEAAEGEPGGRDEQQMQAGRVVTGEAAQDGRPFARDLGVGGGLRRGPADGEQRLAGHSAERGQPVHSDGRLFQQ
ncbi:hypothetical protein [Streptomyces sp. NPDC047123]|uniref:hypothetical protein n=1 Tax=Streptomyces sp. NPDC047123 TaxID=3155622 RepID=UPI0034070F49